MIEEQIFKAILNTLWAVFMKSISMVNTLKSIGLEVNVKPPSPGVSGFNELYDLQTKAVDTILRIFGIDSAMPGSNERQTIFEELYGFLFDICTIYPESEIFPEEYYPKLLELITVSGGITLSWNNKDIDGIYWDNKRFGEFNEQTAEQLTLYKTDISCIKSVNIWANDIKEVKDIIKDMDKSYIEAQKTINISCESCTWQPKQI